LEKIDFLMAGVGGQGTILASNILAEVGLELGYDVKKAEVHGMAQRGGTVESHIRWGDKVYAPVAIQGDVDYLLGFEMLEAGRWPAFIKKRCCGYSKSLSHSASVGKPWESQVPS
jgi:indolepyruvate ferredoxin oxidoreductase beta subunit